MLRPRDRLQLLIAASVVLAGLLPALAQTPIATQAEGGAPAPSLPSRVTFQNHALRHRLEPPLPASVPRKDEPRTQWLARLAAEGRRPVRLDWAGRNDDEPFARLSMNVRGTPTQLPLYVAEPETWTRMFEALAAGATCACTFSAGGFPGRTPDGRVYLGAPLRVGKSASNIVLSWGGSCSDAATDYTVHQGTIGSWYSHQAAKCSTGDVTGTTLTPAAGSSYYLVVPVTDDAEGSYGPRSNKQERPTSTASCRPEWLPTPCHD
jgi:hypothetical protein